MRPSFAFERAVRPRFLVTVARRSSVPDVAAEFARRPVCPAALRPGRRLVRARRLIERQSGECILHRGDRFAFSDSRQGRSGRCPFTVGCGASQLRDQQLTCPIDLGLERKQVTQSISRCHSHASHLFIRVEDFPERFRHGVDRRGVVRKISICQYFAKHFHGRPAHDGLRIARVVPAT